jgi:hypothetical protein
MADGSLLDATPETPLARPRALPAASIFDLRRHAAMLAPNSMTTQRADGNIRPMHSSILLSIGPKPVRSYPKSKDRSLVRRSHLNGRLSSMAKG